MSGEKSALRILPRSAERDSLTPRPRPSKPAPLTALPAATAQALIKSGKIKLDGGARDPRYIGHRSLRRGGQVRLNNEDTLAKYPPTPCPTYGQGNLVDSDWRGNQ